MPRVPTPSARAAVAAKVGGRSGAKWLIALAIVVTAFNLRTAVTSVGPVIDELRDGLGMSGTVAGLLTALPVLTMAGMGAVTPALARRFGQRRLLVGALLVAAIGLMARAAAPWSWLFLLLTVAAMAAGGVGNVVIPTLVKQHFPGHIGRMTAGYTTALATGQAVSAALTVPVSHWGGGDNWRLGLGVWAATALLAVVPWLPLLWPRQPRFGELAVGPMRLVSSPMAWGLTVYFACQSAQAYIVFGWFPQFYQDHGISAAEAGVLLAFLSALMIPLSVIVPNVVARMRTHYAVLMVLVGFAVVGYAGLLVFGAALVWLWTAFAAVGLVGFQASLTLFGLRTRNPETTAALSAFVQSVGYAMSVPGPLLVGVLYEFTGGWGAPFALLFALVAVQAVAALVVGRPRFVDDEMRAPTGAAAARSGD